MKTQGRLASLLWLVLAGMFPGCHPDADVLPPIPVANQEQDGLSYSGVAVLGAPNIPWTGQSGMLVFVVVRNHGDEVWRGRPMAAAYSIAQDGGRGRLLSTAEGVLTRRVNRETFIPTDEVLSIPAHGERESLTFSPVDFNQNPRVFIYWRFVEKGQAPFSFSREIETRGGQLPLSLAEARRLLSR